MTLKITLFVLLCGLLSARTYSQTKYGVKGLVTDTATNIRINEATITVLDAQDSVLQAFAYSSKGTFDIAGLKPGKFLLMVTYPDYADFVEHFTLSAGQPVFDFGHIKMILKSKLLNEVIIKARVAAIKIKGDTTEFNAAAYATQKNAKVEDLLKQLPGMRINQSGAIIFQGESVNKVLVDGEEFFSDDPVLVTKNVRADMVSKVQVYDQKSEQAKLTGIEDGVKVKTINIVLMEDKKKGLFGKTDAGYGTDDYYTAQLLFNKFSPKQKISAYGNLGNTGKVGLSGEDNNRFGGGYSQGDYGGNGIPFARDAGAHFDQKWNQDKQSVNINYKTGALTTDQTRSSHTQNNLPGDFNTREASSTAHNYNFSQSFNGIFNSKLDSTSDLQMLLNGYGNKSKNSSNSTASTVRGNGVLQNTSKIASDGDRNNEYLYASAGYTKRFKKKGRNLRLNARTELSQSSNSNYLRSDLSYYNEQGIPDSSGTIDQYKPGSSRYEGVTAGFSYSDVLMKSVSLTAGYSFSRNINDNEQRSFNRSASNSYNLLDSAFSSDFRMISQSNTFSLNFAYSKGKASANIGTSIADAGFKQTERLSEIRLDRKFVNWQPNANFRYQLSKAASLSFNYSGNTEQPSSYQLQPLRQNTDPLNISLGNPGLKPAFRNNISYYYRVYQPTLDQGINFRGSYSTITNAIVSNRSTDSAGINTLQYFNLERKNQNDWNLYAEVYGHATKLDFILFISFTVRGSTNYNYVNGQLNRVISVNYAPQIDLQKNKTTYSYGMSIGPNYLVNSSSLQKINNNTRGFFTTLNFYTKLPHNFFIGSDATYKFNAKNQVFDRNFEQLLINPYAGKLFLKNESLKLTIKANDLLNQNTGYNRYGSTDSFTESRNETIKRYFMLSLTWDFTKFGKSLQQQQP